MSNPGKKYNEKARLRWHRRMNEMLPEEKLLYKQRKAIYSKEWRAKTAGSDKHLIRKAKQHQKYIDHIILMKYRAFRSKLKGYGITLNQLADLYEKAQGCCTLCRIPYDCLEIEHDHITNKVRGLACPRCNVQLAGYENLLARISLDQLQQYLAGGK